MGYQTEVLADSPALFLPLTEPSGASCADLSTNKFTGTCVGTFTRNVSMGSGVNGIGVGVTLGGTTADRIAVPDNAALNITSDVTYEAWIIPRTIQAAVNNVMSKGYQSGSATQGYQMVVNGSGAANTVILDPAFSGATLTISGNNAVAVGTTTYIACTRTAAGVGTTYINGTQVDQRTVAATIASNNVPFTIGVLQSGAGGGTFAQPFNVTIAAVAIYPTALSSSRIAAHYAARNVADSNATTYTMYFGT